MLVLMVISPLPMVDIKYDLKWKLKTPSFTMKFHAPQTHGHLPLATLDMSIYFTW